MKSLRERLSVGGSFLYVIFFTLALVLAGCGGSGGGGSSSGTSGGGGTGGGGTGGTDGTLSLSWVAPTTNSDGTALTALTDLAGYKVYYGTASGVYGTPTDAGNVTTYSLTGLTKGTTYYVAVTAYDTSNNESVKSTEGSGAAH